MEPMTLAVRRAESDVLLEFAMICAKGQLFAGRRFYFEHPQTATSWTRAAVVHVLSLPGVFSVDCHQCAFGLKSPLGMPIRKATRLLTNSYGIRARFEGKLCTCTVPHRRVEGSEGGHRLSVWSQRYPSAMCQALAEAAIEEALA